MTAVERIAVRAVARVRARLIAALPVEEREGELVLRGRRSAWRWIAGVLR